MNHFWQLFSSHIGVATSIGCCVKKFSFPHLQLFPNFVSFSLSLKCFGSNFLSISLEWGNYFPIYVCTASATSGSLDASSASIVSQSGSLVVYIAGSLAPSNYQPMIIIVKLEVSAGWKPGTSPNSLFGRVTDADNH